MDTISDPVSGLQFYELSHLWGHGTPVWPGDADIIIRKSVYHSRHGVLSRHLTLNMHCSTHINAPAHLVQRAAHVADLPIDRFFGSGVVLKISKGEWGVVTADDLESFGRSVRSRDIVIVNTGWHAKYADSQEYFGRAPGLDRTAADWLVERGVKLFGIDTASVDHPLATSLADHRGGPLMKYLADEYQKVTGRIPKDDFPDWNPAHRRLLSAGIPTIENVGGSLGQVSGRRCSFHAYPWKWEGGDACIIRLMAITDPSGAYRIEPGA